MKQKSPYSNILFSRYIYIYKKLRSDPHHFSTVCWHSYCNRLKTHLRFCINWKTGKELTHLRAHTHTHTPVRAHSHASYMHSHTKETKKKKIRFSPKKYMQHPGAAGSYSRSLPACPSSVWPALRDVQLGFLWGLAPLTGAHPQSGDTPAPWTRVWVTSLLPSENDHHADAR